MSQRLSKWLREFLGFSVAESEGEDPEVLLQREKEILGEKLAHYNRGLAASASLSELLQSQIRELEHREQSLRVSLDAHAQAGQGEDAAGELSLRWQAARHELADLADQLQQAEATSREITAARESAIQVAQQRLAQLKSTLGEYRIQKVLADVINNRSTR